MPEIRRTIMNTFKDAQECQMFVMVLKQKWSEFDVKLKDKLTVEIATDVADRANIPHILQLNPLKILSSLKSGQEERCCHCVINSLQRTVLLLAN